MNKITKPLLNNKLIMNACVDCFFFIKKPLYNIYDLEEEIVSSSKCAKFGTQNMVSGKMDYELAHKSRNIKGKCKPEGIYFVQN